MEWGNKSLGMIFETLQIHPGHPKIYVANSPNLTNNDSPRSKSLHEKIGLTGL